MLIILQYFGKVISIVHESLCIASVGQNVIVYAKNTFFQFSSLQQTCTLFSHINHMGNR
jgi:hypothetical protein